MALFFAEAEVSQDVSSWFLVIQVLQLILTVFMSGSSLGRYLSSDQNPSVVSQSKRPIFFTVKETISHFWHDCML